MRAFEQFIITDTSNPDPEAWPVLRVANSDQMSWSVCLDRMEQLDADLQALTPIPAGLLAVFRYEVKANPRNPSRDW